MTTIVAGSVGPSDIALSTSTFTVGALPITVGTLSATHLNSPSVALTYSIVGGVNATNIGISGGNQLTITSLPASTSWMSVQVRVTDSNTPPQSLMKQFLLRNSAWPL